MQELRTDGMLLFDQVPLLQYDGLNMVQSGAIARYLSRKFGFDGETEDEKLM